MLRAAGDDEARATALIVQAAELGVPAACAEAAKHFELRDPPLAFEWCALVEDSAYLA
jgi:hypothetical protein